MANEGGFFTHNIPVRTTDKLREYVSTNYGDMVDEAWTHYSAQADAGVERAVADAFGDAQFSYGARCLAREISKRNSGRIATCFTHAGGEHV